MKKQELIPKNKHAPAPQTGRHIEFHTGPLPHPSVLSEYDRIHPGFAERIMSLAEKESEHRHNLEKQSIEVEMEDHRQQNIEIRIGQIFAFSIGVITILAGSYTAINGAQIAGSLIGTAGVAGLASVFIIGHKGGK